MQTGMKILGVFLTARRGFTRLVRSENEFRQHSYTLCVFS